MTVHCDSIDIYVMNKFVDRESFFTGENDNSKYQNDAAIAESNSTKGIPLDRGGNWVEIIGEMKNFSVKLFKSSSIFAGSFKSQLIDYFRGRIVSWEKVEGSLWQFSDN